MKQKKIREVTGLFQKGLVDKMSMPGMLHGGVGI